MMYRKGWLWILLPLLALGGCEAESDPGEQSEQEVADQSDQELADQSDQGDTLSCPSGQKLCGTNCVSVASDKANCGECGNDCKALDKVNPEQVVCTNGACVIGQCLAGWADCSAGVADGCETDLNTSLLHCGACDNDCRELPHVDTAGLSCSSGACALAPNGCEAGWGNCNGNAADGCEADLTRIETCGDCDTECTGIEVCASGECNESCPNGETNCDRSCADLQTSETHCGACGHACVGQEQCIDGTCECQPDCQPGNECGDDGCGGKCGQCTAPETCQPDNTCACIPQCAGRLCGSDGCGGTCAPGCGNGEKCTSDGTACVLDCPNGTTDCGDSCADLSIDVNHCGACDTNCQDPMPAHTVDAGCVGGACVWACANGWGDCDDTNPDCEVELSTSELHCGGCDQPCAGECRGGHCCVDTCTTEGEKRCDATRPQNVETCEVDSNGCLHWVTKAVCAPMQLCAVAETEKCIVAQPFQIFMDSDIPWSQQWDFAFRPDGSFITVWTQKNSAPCNHDPDRGGICGRIFPPNGDITSSTVFAGNPGHTHSHQVDPCVAVQPDGTFAVAYDTTRDSDGCWWIDGHHFDATGGWKGDFAVNHSTCSKMDATADAASSAGIYWFSWSNGDSLSNPQYQAKARAFSYSSEQITAAHGSDLLLAPQYSRSAVIDVNDSGAAVVVYMRSGAGGDEQGGVFAKRFDSLGNQVGNEIHVNAVTSGHQEGTGLVVNPDGSFVVAFSSDNGGVLTARLRLVDSNGSPVGSEVLVANMPSGAGSASPVIAQAPDGSYLVVWQGDSDGSGGGSIQGRWYDSALVPMGTSDFRVNGTTNDKQWYPRAQILPADGTILVCYNNDDNYTHYALATTFECRLLPPYWNRP